MVHRTSTSTRIGHTGRPGWVALAFARLARFEANPTVEAVASIEVSGIRMGGVPGLEALAMEFAERAWAAGAGRGDGKLHT